MFIFGWKKYRPYKSKILLKLYPLWTSFIFYVIFDPHSNQVRKFPHSKFLEWVVKQFTQNDIIRKWKTYFKKKKKKTLFIWIQIL